MPMWGPRQSAKTALADEISDYGRSRLSIIKLANNTYYWRHPVDGTERIRLHKTDILVKHTDGRVELFDGGFMTKTTKNRLNSFSKLFGVPLSIYSAQGVWTISYQGIALPYFDGFTFPDHVGNPKLEAHSEQINKRDANLKMARRIATVRNAVTDSILRDAMAWAGYTQVAIYNAPTWFDERRRTQIVKRYLNTTAGLVA